MEAGKTASFVDGENTVPEMRKVEQEAQIARTEEAQKGTPGDLSPPIKEINMRYGEAGEQPASSVNEELQEGQEEGKIGGEGGTKVYKDRIKTISVEDRRKLDGWKYTPDEDLYLKYKEVFDNPKYYNQITGEINWPSNDGFIDLPTDELLEPGIKIDRYGYDSGFFASPVGTPYEMRALPPGSDIKPYNVFEVEKPLRVKSGKIAPWFDEIGGGIQYLLPESVEDLLAAGIIRRID